MSVALEVVLSELDLPPEQVLDGFPGYGLLRLSAGTLREQFGFGVVRDETAEEPWHGGVHGKKTKGKRRGLAALDVDWVVAPPVSEK